MNTTYIPLAPQGAQHTQRIITKACSKVVGGIGIPMNRVAILLILFVMGINVAWGDTTIGNTDNSSAWWTAFSEYYSIESGGAYHFTFKNYNDGADIWHNWVLCCTNDHDRNDNANGYKEYFILRGDHQNGTGGYWGDGTNSVTDTYLSTDGLTDENFMTEMNGADVDVTVAYAGTTITATATVTTSSGKTFKREIVSTGISGKVRLFFTVEKAHLENFAQSNTKVDPTLTFASSSASVAANGTTTNAATTNSNGAITYSIATADQQYATIDASSGKVTGVEETTSPITVTATVAGTDVFNSKTATYQLTVTAPETYTTYYSNDYEDQNVQWTTSTNGRYTPVIMSDDTHYMSVNQDQRQNNGCTLTSTETNGKAATGTNFVMTCRVKLGASSNQAATAFNIYDASNSTMLLSLAEGTANATAWKINGNENQKVTISAGGAKAISALAWYTLTITYSANDSKTFLTVKDANGDIVDDFDRTEITNTSTGGLGKMTFATSRYNANFAIDDILVRSATSSDIPKLANYTINYIYTNDSGTKTTVKSETGQAITDRYKSASDPIVGDDGTKYYLDNNKTTSILISETEENVLNVNVRKARSCNYTVKANLGDVFASGTYIEGDDDITVAYPKYILKDGKLYAKAANTDGDWWRITFTPDVEKEEDIKTIEYTLDVANVVSYVECEDIEGVTVSEHTSRASMAKMGYTANASTYLPFATLNKGFYRVYCHGISGNGVVHITNIKAGDNVVLTTYIPNSTDFTANSETFEITEDNTQISFASEGSTSAGIDWIYIVGLGNTGYDYTINTDKGFTMKSGKVSAAEDSYTVYWPKYFEHDDKWYMTEAPYGTVVANNAATTKTINVTECQGVVSFMEAETVLARQYTGSLSNTNASGGFAAGANADATITTTSAFPAGRYNLYVSALQRTANADTYTLQTSTDNSTYTETGQTLIIPSGDNIVSMAFTLDNDSYIRLTETTGNNSYHYVDYLLLTRRSPSVTFDETALTTFAARKQGYPFTVDASWHTGHTIYMKIDGGEQVTYDASQTYHALNNVEIWFDDSEHETYYVSDAKAFDPTKKWAAFCYKEGFTDSNVPYDATQATVLLNGLKENYNVVTVDISDFTEENYNTTLLSKAQDIASADLVVVSEAVNSRTQEGQNGSFVQYVLPTYILNQTNVLNMKLFVYPRDTWKWIEADKGVDNFTSSDQLSITPKNRYAKIFDGVDFNSDGSITLFTERKALNHLHGYTTSTGLDGAGGQLAPKPDGTNGTTVMQPLATALDGSTEKTVMDYYKYTDPSDATKSYQYVGFGISIDDYPHYSSNLGTIIANVGNAMANGEGMTTEITSLDAPVITDNGDGRAKITSTSKSATVYYVTSNTELTADQIIASTDKAVVKNNLTKKFSSTNSTVTVYAVAYIKKVDNTEIKSAVSHVTVNVDNSRTITRTVSNSETDVTGTEVTMTYTAGATTTIPYNQTYKKEGYTVTSWIDTNTGTTYNPGTSITVDQDLNLQAVFTANAHKVTDLKEESETQRTAKFCFLHKDGAAWMSGVSGIMVGQVHFSDGTFIDIPCEYSLVGGNSPVDNSTQPGKFNNTFTNSSTAHEGTEILEYAQVKIGTLFQFPAVYGMTVKYKAEDLVWTSNTSILRTYVTYSTLKDGKITNPAFNTTTCPATPTVPSGTNDNYATGGIYSYTGNDETAQFTSLDPSAVIEAKTPSDITAGMTGGWQEASAFMNSLSVTYPSLYEIKSVSLENATYNDDTDLNKAGTLTSTDAPGNTDGKFPGGMAVKIEVTPSYPYYFSKIESLDFPNQDTVKVHYNYTTNQSTSQTAPTGTFYYSDIVSKNIYGGSYTFAVSKDMDNITAYIQRLTTYTINTDATPFRSGVVTLPDDRTAFAANNIITLTAKPKVGYTHIEGSDGWENDKGQSFIASETGVVRAMVKDTLRLLVTETSAKETYVAKFTSIGTKTGTLFNDLSTVPDGTIIEGFPKSETNTSIAIPKYYTLYKDGYTLHNWQVTKPETLANTKFDVGTSVPFTTINEVTAQPNFTENTTDFNYRTTTADITWDFRTAYYAQKMTFGNNKTLYYSTHASINSPAVEIDVPIIINTGAKGQIDNSNVDDWCLIGEGTSITIPSGKGATFTLATYSPITSTNIDGDILTDSTSTTESGQKVYLYSYTTQSTATTVTLTIGDDFTYYKYIRAHLPSADHVALNMSVNDKTMGSVTLTSAKTEKSGGTDVTTNPTSEGCTLPLGTWVTISANRNNLYEFDHWEVNDETVTDGDVYTITTNDAVDVEAGGVNSTILFQITSYETSVYAVFKAREQYQVKFLTGSADGAAPDAIHVELGKTFDMPKCNQTLFLEGQTLKYWTDANGAEYNWGEQNLYINSDVTLTPVFEADEFTLVDIDSEKGNATATWNLTQTGDNKAPDLSYSGSTGIYVTQLTYNGKTIDIKLDLNSPGSTSSIDNTADASYCAIKSGAIISVPTTPGCEIRLSVKTGNDDEISKTTIAGTVGSWDKSTATSTATYDGEMGTQDIDFMGDVETFTTISVTYKQIPSTIAIPSITNVRYGDQQMSEADLVTLVSTKTVSNVSINHTTNDELPVITASCNNDGIATVIQPTSMTNAKASIAVRSAGGILIGTYTVNFTVNKPTGAPTLTGITVNGVAATTTDNGATWIVPGIQPVTGLISLHFDRKMAEYTADISDYGVALHLHADAGKDLNIEYYDLPVGFQIPVKMWKWYFTDVYGTHWSDDENETSTVYVQMANTKLSVKKRMIDFVVTKTYSSEYSHKGQGPLPATTNVLDDATITRLTAKGIHVGTIDEAITNANDVPYGINNAGATDNERFYVFVPDGSYQMTGNSDLAISQEFIEESAANNSDGTAASLTVGTTFSNGRSYLNRNKGQISIVGQSQDKTILWNKPYFYGMSYTSTLEIRGIQDCYLQDLTLSNLFSDYQVADGSNPWGEAVAFYDRGERTIMKNVSVLGYKDTYVSDVTVTADKRGRNYYEGCNFAGTTDFIRGDGDIWWQGCKILLRHCSVDAEKGIGVITCPRTSTDNKYGYVFSNDTIDAYDDYGLVLSDEYYLGRPWNNQPMVSYLNTTMKILPNAVGWAPYTKNLVLQMREYNSKDGSGNTVPLTSRSIDGLSPASGSLDPVMLASDAATYTSANVLGGGEAYEPSLYTAQRPKVSDIDFNDNVLAWTDDAEALCYFIFRSETETGEYKLYDITTSNSYTFEGDFSGWFIVRAANLRGGLGVATTPIEYKNVEKYSLAMTTTLYTCNDTTDDYNGKDVTWSTICLPFNGKVPTVDADNDGKNDITVYAAKSIKNNTITLAKVNYITAKEGYVVYGIPGTYVFRSSSHTSEEADTITTRLNGNPSLTAAISASGYNCYTLAYKPNISGIGFYKFTGKTLACNRAWLDVEAYISLNESSDDEETLQQAASAKGIRFVFENLDTSNTGVTEFTIDYKDDDKIYDLNGIRVETPVRGRIYIIRGKKILWK